MNTISKRVSAIIAGTLLFIGPGAARAVDSVTYYYTDAQGTVLMTTDSAGTPLTSADYQPYGAPALGQADGGPSYTGHVSDPDSGLIYMQARYYEPMLGRFLSTDPANATLGILTTSTATVT